MEGLFKNKYRIPTARLQSWNYANEGMYFVTICTANREYYFGEIIDATNANGANGGVETQCLASLHEPPFRQMQLSEMGNVATAEWIKTIELRPDMNLELGEYVVMPNHVHGIIMIGENEYNCNNQSQHPELEFTPGNKFGPQSKNLAAIMRGYKSAVTTYARQKNIQFGWQARFHDHIIRSAAEYERITNYIINNPANWKGDKFYGPVR